MDLGNIYLYVVPLTLGVPASVFAGGLIMRRGQWCSWGVVEMGDRFSTSLNSQTVSASGKRFLNPYRTQCSISLWMHYVISVDHSDSWGPRQW